MTEQKPETALTLKPTQPTAPAVVSSEGAENYDGAGEKAVGKPEREVLLAPVNPGELEILPTGEVYLPQVHYRRRLNQAFGPGGWALVPLGRILIQGETLCRQYALRAAGRFIAEAFGEAEYHATNARMSWASAAEAAKSNALMRCCKDLGIAWECWDREYTEAWTKQYCVLVQAFRYGKSRQEWRRADRPKLDGEQKVIHGTTVETTAEAAGAGAQGSQEANGDAGQGTGWAKGTEEPHVASEGAGMVLGADDIVELFEQLPTPEKLTLEAARDSLMLLLNFWSQETRPAALWAASKFKSDKGKEIGVKGPIELQRTKKDGTFSVSEKWCSAIYAKLYKSAKGNIDKLKAEQKAEQGGAEQAQQEGGQDDGSEQTTKPEDVG